MHSIAVMPLFARGYKHTEWLRCQICMCLPMHESFVHDHPLYAIARYFVYSSIHSLCLASSFPHVYSPAGGSSIVGCRMRPPKSLRRERSSFAGRRQAATLSVAHNCIYIILHASPRIRGVNTPQPEDGNKLYQPKFRAEHGGVPITTTRSILDDLGCTYLGVWHPDRDEFEFNHRGGEGYGHIISCDCLSICLYCVHP